MLTKFFAKVLGLWILIAILSLLVNRDSAISMLNAFFADAPLVFITGVFTVVIGLAIVVSHNRWSGGLLPVVVTLYGWIALVKGFTLLAVSPAEQARLWGQLHFADGFYAYCIVAVVIGAYLTYEGFRPSPGDSATS